MLADLLPTSGPIRRPPAERLLALAASLAALSSRERYACLRRQARRRRLTLRSVTRWVDASASSGGRLVDLVAVCRETAAALEAMINADPGGSRRLLASDMMWPPALAVGAQCPSPPTSACWSWPAGPAAPVPARRSGIRATAVITAVTRWPHRRIRGPAR